MTTKPAFDNEKYIREQKTEILERADHFDNKLYLACFQSIAGL